jgi:hypothetical protein
VAAINFGSYTKDPDEVVDLSFDWTKELDGDTISTSTWPAVVGITQATPSKDDMTTTTWVSAGSAGTDYRIVNRVVTAGGRTLEGSITVAVRTA